jgi:two-component system, NarL family, sensor histidine kinase UhpB
MRGSTPPSFVDSGAPHSQPPHDSLTPRPTDGESDADARRWSRRHRGRRPADRRTALMARDRVRVREHERRRIAQDLHDQLGGTITALRVRLELLSHLRDEHDMRRSAADLIGVAALLDRELDVVAWTLHPDAFTRVGLVPAVTTLVHDWSQLYGVSAILHTTPMNRSLTGTVQRCVFRVCQEALTNISKHAHATQVTVALEQQRDTLLLLVHDNGRGFDPDEAARAPRAMGLTGMRERASGVGGRIEITASSGSGTAVSMRVPAAFTRQRQPRAQTRVLSPGTRP